MKYEEWREVPDEEFEVEDECEEDEDEDRLYYGCCGDDNRADESWASVEHWDAVY